MRSIQFITIVTLVAVLSASCYKRNNWGIRGSGGNITEVRHVSGFDRIDLDISADVEYTQDSAYFLEVEAQSNILPVLETKVKDGELEIDFKRNVWDHNKVKVRVHSPSLNGVSISGSGDVRVNDLLKSNQLHIGISGSGCIFIPELEGNSIDARISGSGNISVTAGEVNSAIYTISGSGDIKALNLVASSAMTRISGSGNISVHAEEKLEVNISGSGDVRYRGRPIITTNISGSGDLIHQD